MTSPTKALFPLWRGEDAFAPQLDALEAAMLADYPGLATAINHTPFALFEAAQSVQPPMLGYSRVTPSLRTIAEIVPESLRSPWLCMLLVWHLRQFPYRFPATGLDQEFTEHYTDCYNRIIDQIRADPGFAVLGNDSFMKDLGLARLSIIPAVAQLLYPHAGLSLKPVVRGGPRLWSYVWGRCGGRAPMIEIHTHGPMASTYFNASGWEETYRLTALVMQSMPAARALVGLSWFYDPQLSTVSPRLNYLRTSPLAQGGRLIRIGTFPDTIVNATSTSKSRRELYEAGEYTPVAHALVWSRKDMVRSYGA